MEYDGGFAWIPICAAISAVCTIVSVGVTVAAAAGLVDKNLASKVNAVATTVGVVAGYASGIGTLYSSTAETATNVLLKATLDVSLKPGLSIASCGL